MADASNTTVTCPSCQRQYQWRDTVAGKNVRCRCGKIFTMPQQLPPGDHKPSTPNDDWLEQAPPLEAKSDGHGLDFFSPILSKPDSEEDFDFDSLFQKPDENDASASQAAGDSADSNRHGRSGRDVGSLADDDTIPLDVPDSMKSAKDQPIRKCPSCNLPMKPNAVVCINCGFNLNEGGKIKTKVIDPDAKANHAPGEDAFYNAAQVKNHEVVAPSELERPLIDSASDNSAVAQRYKSSVAEALRKREDDASNSKVADVYLPLIFFVAGGGFMFMGGMHLEWSIPKTIAAIGTDLLVKVPLLVIAVFMAAKYMDISFGPLGKAVYKLASIGIGPLALADLLMIYIAIATFGTGMLLSFVFYIILAGIPLAYMFDLDFPDTMVTVLSICLVTFFYPILQKFFLLGFS